MAQDNPDFDPTRYRILVVDDERGFLNLIKISLNHEGYQVEVAGDAYAGFDILERQAFDLAIIDTLMPIMDGFEMVDRIRADKRWHRLPVIIFGAGDDPERIAALEHGADDWMCKPMSHRPLVAKIREVLLRTRG